jgi:ATP-dependent helicase/nuclease subunit B
MITSSINRIFVGWQGPLLPWLAAELVSKYRVGNLVDLRHVTLVMPGGHAMRRLSELLSAELSRTETFSNQAVLLPPTLLTMGELSEKLLPETSNCALEADRILAWVDALRTTGEKSLKVLVPQVPDLKDFRPWLALAEKIDSLHIEITGAGLTFIDVAKRSLELASFLDEERWLVLAQISDIYCQKLLERGLVDKYFNRLQQLKVTGVIKLEGPLYFVSISEINQNMRDLLNKLSGDINAVIYAPNEYADGFDRYGAVIPSYWENKIIPLKENSLNISENTQDLVAGLYLKLENLSKTHSLNDISIGIGDEQEIDYIKGSLSSHGINVRTAKGRKFSESELGFFLKGLGQYLASRSMQHFSALIRHPYISSKIKVADDQEQISFQEFLDRYQERHLQAQISEQMPEQGQADRKFLLLLDQFELLLKGLKQPSRTITSWLPNVLELVKSIVPETYETEQFELVVKSLKTLDTQAELKASEVIQLIIHLADKLAPLPDQQIQAIELLGWLELTLDDAPTLLLTSIAESVVPEVISADPFLPNTLRMHLGLVNNASRLARDAFLLTTMLHSKKELAIFLAQRSLDGSPRFPSRLLLSCKDNELAERTKFLYQQGKRFSLRAKENQPISRWQLPKPTVHEIQSMTVTSFKDYLACPYRFYLKHILNLKEVSHSNFELDALSFGTFTHKVLDLFARDSKSNATDPEILFNLLEQILDTTAKNTYGAHAYPAIKVQLDLLKERLRHFSFWQANRNQMGWVITAHEYVIDPESCFLDLADKRIGLRGRIDRIDYNQKLNQYQIIDYKTGDAGHDLKYVIKNGIWTDLQMPLYFHALRSRYSENQISFAYLNLSADNQREQLIELNEDINMFHLGIEQAKEIASKVVQGLFWPANQKAQNDSFDWIVAAAFDSDSLQSEEFYE